jgi:membrane protein insertase Oxa1/YidC/SpoIIIJ
MTVIIEKILSSLYNLSHGFFLTIVLLAFVINIFVELINSRIKPLLKRTLDYNSFVKKKEIEIKEKINIKSLVNKEIFRLHKKYNYHPLYDFVAVVPFLVQLPFLLGVYFAIKNFKPFIGLTFLNIENISNPDNLIEGINLLPFLMTIVSVLLTIVHRNRFKLKDFVLPFLFFILLYNSPSSLIIYWTISMLIAFMLNLFKKTKYWDIISKKSKKLKELKIIY